jgi:hypothetical protein
MIQLLQLSGFNIAADIAGNRISWRRIEAIINAAAFMLGNIYKTYI